MPLRSLAGKGSDAGGRSSQTQRAKVSINAASKTMLKTRRARPNNLGAFADRSSFGADTEKFIRAF